MAFSGQLSQHSLWSKLEFRHSQSIPPLRTNQELVQKASQEKLKIGTINRKSNSLVTCSMLNPHNGMSLFSHGSESLFSPSYNIKKFYSSINNKDLRQLALLIAEDCFFDDFSFTEPFRGRKEALIFLEQLTTCMGKNTEFCIEHIYEGIDLTTVVNWHIEWKKKRVPFTRGCSCYEFSRDGEHLVIRKAQVIIESPIKPGSLALELFQKVISIFDAFPEVAEWFLMSPQLLVNIYNIVLRPSLGPIVAWYQTLWSIGLTFLRLIYKLIQIITGNFHK